MKPAELVDMMIQGIERVEPEVVVGRLNPGATGFRCHLPDGSLFHVRVEQPQGFNWPNLTVWDDYDWENAPLIDDDCGDWLQSMSWGGFAETGPEFMEGMGWYKLPEAEQREAVETFMEYPRARHMPAAVKDHLIALGLLDDNPPSEE